MSGPIEIRSFRRVFDLERRIYSIDRLRLNPGGVPLRGVVYFLALVFLGLLTAVVPVVGVVSRSLPWYLRDVGLPAAAATVLSAIRIEGRSFHLAALALVRHRLEPAHLACCRRADSAGARWRPQPIVILPDGSDSRLRRLRYTGPGAVLVCVEHERRGRAREQGRRGTARPGLRAALVITGRDHARPLDRGQVVALGSGSRLLVRRSTSRTVDR